MEDILEAVVQASETFTLPKPWHRLVCDPAFLRLPSDTAALWANLRQQFTDDLLVRAGVAAADAAGNVGLAPQLRAGATIWAIRNEPGEKVTTLIASDLKPLPSGGWALRAAWQDHRQREQIEARDTPLFVAYTLEDLAILRSLGLAAVPGDDWRRLGKPQLDFLRQLLRITQSKTTALPYGAQPGRPTNLVNWSLATLDRANVPVAKSSWAHLGKLHQHLHLALNNFVLWQPSAQRLGQLRYELRYLNLPEVRARLVKGIDQESRTIEDGLHPPKPPPTSIPEAYRAWRQAERVTANAYGRQKAFEHLCELMERQRFEPLMAGALRTTNPLLRNLQIAVAETTRLLQPMLGSGLI